MRYYRKDIKCRDCSLSERTKVWGTGPKGAKIVFVGEAPGADEDESGYPFVGPAGQYFTRGLQGVGIDRNRCWITNALSCRPPRNEFWSVEGREAQTCCLSGFYEELDWLRENGAKVFIPLGNNACSAFNLTGGIFKIRGSVYTNPRWPGIPILPTFHPSFLNRRTMGKKYSGADDPNPISVDPKYVWWADLRKAKRLAEEGWTPPEENFNLFPTLEELREYAKRVIEEKKEIAVDIETTGFNLGFALVVVIGLADSPTTGISIPLLKKGRAPYWPNGQQNEVKRIVSEIFQNCPLLFQNCLFDIPFLQRDGFEIDYGRVEDDIMLLHHAVCPELPHNLGFIVSLYGDTPYWKEDFLNRTESILSLDDSELRTYNLRDCVVLHQVRPGLRKDLKEIGTERVYEEESLALLPAIADMKKWGIGIDKGRLSRYRAKLSKDILLLERKIRQDFSFPPAFTFTDQELGWFLYGEEPTKFRKLEELREYDPETTTKKKPLRKGTNKHRELLEILEIKEKAGSLYYPIGWKGRKSRKTGRLKTDDQGRLSFQIALQNRLAGIGRFKRLSPKHREERETIQRLLAFLKDLNELKRVKKEKSTYTSYPIGKDNRVRTSLLIHGTATGRLASKDPNLQNIPKKNLEARRCFVPEEGFIFLSRDYNNLEVRILAYETEDEELIKFLENGGNIHDENTRTLFSLSPDSPSWSLGRRAAKIFQFGRIQYGGSPREVYEQVCLEAPDLHLTFSDFQKAEENYRQKHLPYRLWYDGIEGSVSQSRQTRTFYGRCRTLLGSQRDIFKQALNTPVQGSAADIINLATIRIHKRLKEERYRSRLILNIHDELLFEVWKPELERLLQLTKEEMEKPVDYRGKIVIFPTEVKTGPDWGSLKAVKE